MHRILLITASLLLATPSAFAQPSEEKVDVETSRKAIQIGKQALAKFEEGAHDEAYDLFAQADQLVHSPTFTLYMARCRRKAGKLKEALELYEQVAQETLPESAPDPWKAAQTTAKSEAEVVSREMPRIRIRVRAGELSVAQLDGAPVDASAPIPANPGAYTLILRSKEGETKRREITLEPGREVVIEVDFAPPSPDPPPRPVPIPLPPPKLVPVPPAPETEATPLYWPGGLALGVGGAGLIAGTVLGGLAMARASDFQNDECDGNSCYADSEDDAADILQLAHGATGALVAGGVLSAVGVVLLIVPPTDEGTVEVEAGLSGVTFRGHF